MLVVSDTSPIRALSAIGHLRLIESLYGKALLPPAVVAELTVPLAHLPPIRMTELPFLVQQAPTDPRRTLELRETLGPGESEAIALALEVHAQAILIDELRGRTVAEQLGLKPIGVLAVLANAKSAGLIAAVAPLIGELKATISFRVHPELLARVLRSVGEA